MKKSIEFESPDFSGLITDLLAMGESADAVALEAAEAYGQAGIQAVRNSYLGMVKGAVAGDYIWSSIGFRMVKPDKGNALVWGGVGVYMIPSVEAAFGRTIHDITAAQMAYWFEFGITRYKSGAAKPRSTPWSEGKKIAPTVSTTPMPFVGNASVTGFESMNKAFDKKLNELMG